MTRPDSGGWLAPAFAIVAAVTALRLGLLVFNRTDLFVDESQYWLWGQSFAYGYYSKPPLIAWVIGAVTALSGSDSAFWVRAPGAVFHGAAAMILAATAARLGGARAAIWVAASYVTLPMATMGSLLASTDTIMAPFFAAALYCHTRLVETRALRFALLAGVMAGLAVLAKYAGVYFLLGAGLGALFIPALRLGVRNWTALLAAFGLVILPNVLWNLNNGMATASHTLDNVRWVRDAKPLNPAGMAEFFLSQFAVFGPVLFAALIRAALHPRAAGTGRLLVFALPAVVIVCLQALLDRAYANWAASAYLAGTILAVMVLLDRPRLLKLSLAVNGAIAVILPVLTLFPALTLGRDEPLLARYLGQAALSRQIIGLAQAEGGLPIVADRRDVLADLFHTGQGAGVTVYAPRPAGRPANHYEQAHPLPTALTGPILMVTERPPVCRGTPARPVATFDLAGGSYADLPLAGYVIDAECLHAP
ncbi:MAG: glycosyltransferase family 39 protein [Rhodobacter sp.]|nr:glycosyltransferase family 39 protein [Rhodobacter sp.]